MKSAVVLAVLWCLVSQALPVSAERAPNYDRIRAALQRPVAPGRLGVSVASLSTIRPSSLQARGGGPRDTVLNGLLIGAAIGAGGGYIWATKLCGPNDSECSIRATPVGVLGGAAIGGAIGAMLDALHK